MNTGKLEVKSDNIDILYAVKQAKIDVKYAKTIN